MIPGLKARIFLLAPLSLSAYPLTSGLGPTKLICPKSTFKISGNSSIFVFLKYLPILVILLSSETVIVIFSLFFHRSKLYNIELFASLPILFARKILETLNQLQLEMKLQEKRKQ